MAVAGQTRRTYGGPCGVCGHSSAGLWQSPTVPPVGWFAWLRREPDGSTTLEDWVCSERCRLECDWQQDAEHIGIELVAALPPNESTSARVRIENTPAPLQRPLECPDCGCEEFALLLEVGTAVRAAMRCRQCALVLTVNTES